MRLDVERCLRNAHLLKQMLEAAGVGGTFLNELSSTVVFERPAEEAFVRKWQLACEGEIAHVVVDEPAAVIRDRLGAALAEPMVERLTERGVVVDGKEYEVQFDDWMYLMTDKVMLNKATMRKFGVRLGEVTLSFTKR